MKTSSMAWPWVTSSNSIWTALFCPCYHPLSTHAGQQNLGPASTLQVRRFGCHLACCCCSLPSPCFCHVCSCITSNSCSNSCLTYNMSLSLPRVKSSHAGKFLKAVIAKDSDRVNATKGSPCFDAGRNVLLPLRLITTPS